MPKLQTTTTINIDESVFSVADMSQNVQALVAMFDDWRQKLADAEQDVLLYRIALARVQQDLIDTIAKEKEEAEKAATAEEEVVFTEETPAE